MQHLQPFSVQATIDGNNVEVSVTFGHHCFTDEKANGDQFFWNNEVRYFCIDRYNASLGLPTLVSDILTKQDCHITAFHNHTSQECYYHVDFVDYAVFMTIKRPGNRNDQLKVHITSAYEKDAWGNLPNGPTKKMHFILSERFKGNLILKRKKRGQ